MDASIQAVSLHINEQQQLSHETTSSLGLSQYPSTSCQYAVFMRAAGMTQSDQELACIHADALLVQQRLELSAGLKEVAANTAMKQQQMIASTIKREKQSDIYGARTAKDKRMAEAAIEAAGKPPSNAAVSLLLAAVA